MSNLQSKWINSGEAAQIASVASSTTRKATAQIVQIRRHAERRRSCETTCSRPASDIRGVLAHGTIIGAL
ncbi:MAG: hypothetical protein ACFHWZ_01525 [Phycisphaerales bacterium]